MLGYLEKKTFSVHDVQIVRLGRIDRSELRVLTENLPPADVQAAT
jgi:hypothetical protein